MGVVVQTPGIQGPPGPAGTTDYNQLANRPDLTPYARNNTKLAEQGFLTRAIRTTVSRVTMPRAAAYQTFVTPYGGTNEVVHPSIYYNASGWNGYPYWLAITPYQGGNHNVENPCIYASNDGNTWVTPPGLTNPVDPQPTGGYNSDPDILVVDNTMYLFWRSVFATTEVIYYRTSTDGVIWSAKTALITSDQTVRRPVSPAFLYDQVTGQWTVFANESLNEPNTILRWQASTLAGLSTATPVTCSLSVPGRDLWHLDVCRWGSELHMLFTDSGIDTDGQSGALYFAVSVDGGLTWTRTDNPVIPALPAGVTWDSLLYRPTMTPSVVEGEEGYDVWYGSSNPEWRVGRTRLSLSGHRDKTTGQVHGAFDISHINKLAAFRGLTPYVFGDSFSRPDSTTALGNADSGPAPVVTAGTWGIAGGKAGAQTATNSRAHWETGLSDAVVEVDVSGVVGASDSVWIVLRLVDASNYIRLGCGGAGGSLVFQEIVAGAVNQINPGFGSWSPAGASLKVVLSGTTMTVYLNGNLLGSRTSSQFTTATKHGIQAQTTATRFDNLTVRALVNGA